jgi:hypothetical protein
MVLLIEGCPSNGFPRFRRLLLMLAASLLGDGLQERERSGPTLG